MKILARLLSVMVIALALSLNTNLSLSSGASSELVKDDIFEIKDENLPIVIKSDRLVGDNEKNTVVFCGNVVATRGDFIISSESISIIYDRGNKRVKELIAEGSVRITQGDRTATGEKALYLNSEDKITLTGNPKVWEGDNKIEGGKIILFLAEDRGVVEANEHTRVSATIYLEKGGGEKTD